MKLFDHFERIKKMNKLIASGHTGTPHEFAETMGISQSHLFRCLHELEEFGLDIHYSRNLKTYYYGNANELKVNYSMKLIADSFAREIIGGERIMKDSSTITL
jgi:hypothetical protein